MNDERFLTFHDKPFLRLGKDHSDFPWHRFEVDEVLGQDEVLKELDRLTQILGDMDTADNDTEERWEMHDEAALNSLAEPFSQTAYHFINPRGTKDEVWAIQYWPDENVIAFRDAE